MQSVSYGTYIFNKPCIDSSPFTKKNPLIHHDFVPPKKLVFPVLKKQKPLIVKSSIKDLVKTSAGLTNRIFQSFAAFDTWFFQSLSNMVAFKSGGGLFKDGDLPLFKEEDLIQLKHNGNCIVGVVQHIGFLETTLIGPIGLIILQNSKIDLCSIINFTEITGSERLFGFHTGVDYKANPKFVMEEIESLLDKDLNDEENIAYSVVYILPSDYEKIRVSCVLKCSKLQIPQLRSYLQFGGQVLTAIDRVVYRNKCCG